MAASDPIDPQPIPLPQNSPASSPAPLAPDHPPLPFFVSPCAFSWQSLRNPSSAAMAVRSDMPRTPHPLSQALLAQESAREALPAGSRSVSPHHIPNPTRERPFEAHQIPSPFLGPKISLPPSPAPHSGPSPTSLFSCLFVPFRGNPFAIPAVPQWPCEALYREPPTPTCERHFEIPSPFLCPKIPLPPLPPPSLRTIPHFPFSCLFVPFRGNPFAIPAVLQWPCERSVCEFRRKSRPIPPRAKTPTHQFCNTPLQIDQHLRPTLPDANTHNHTTYNHTPNPTFCTPPHTRRKTPRSRHTTPRTHPPRNFPKCSILVLTFIGKYVY